ncbi:phosphoglucomutase/phosphomannomutase PgmG [Novosphingobium sp.]|uniref:phosphoglucomutase/phosphomannomutase PgmG n=1 Tax=Novosphingobium sp. TaxID=1874826 RepID=UPI002735DE92|nr:phosphomannomutase/phosphoglucomutase [Novosphingobium sp.]MDP3906376.1 phosphomannomutase/phosphoglucomutase [Novosphingobium sp.]
MAHRFHRSILREYDVRGVVGETLGPDDAHAIGRSFATMVRRTGGRAVAVGRDGRISSPELEAALVAGLTASGADVVQIGLGPTPMLYYAEATLPAVQGGIQVTGSHNPADHNGFKIVHEGLPVFGDELQQLGRMAAAGDWQEGMGRVEQRDVLGAYVDRLAAGLAGIDHAALATLRIGWDAGNGAAGPAIECLTRKLPGEHHLLFTQVDGTFPNHHPDPTVERNLDDLRALVAAKSLHFGVAFDGDGDRIGAVDSTGRVIWGDQLLMIYAEDLLQRLPGSTIVADVKASGVLFDRIATLGGRPHMWKTGHSLIKSEMKRIAAPLGGEMTGHVCFADDFYGFDDALYAAVRLIAASVRLGRSVTQLRDAIPAVVNTPELRFKVDDLRKFPVVDEVRERLERAGADVNPIDGVRVTTPDGWWLLRASNTQDVLVVRAESGDAAGLGRLLAEVDAQLALSGVSRGPQIDH